MYSHCHASTRGLHNQMATKLATDSHAHQHTIQAISTWKSAAAAAAVPVHATAMMTLVVEASEASELWRK